MPERITVEVTYVLGGTVQDPDVYTAVKARSTVSRRQGSGVLNLRLTDGSDTAGKVLWVTYAPDLKAVARPVDAGETSKLLEVR